MNTEKALTFLTEENIRTATLVAMALDALQKIEFDEKFQQIAPAVCEQKMIELCEEGVKDYVSLGFGANGYGVMLNASALLTTTSVLGLDSLATTVAETIAKS